MKIIAISYIIILSCLTISCNRESNLPYKMETPMDSATLATVWLTTPIKYNYDEINKISSELRDKTNKGQRLTIQFGLPYSNKFDQVAYALVDYPIWKPTIDTLKTKDLNDVPVKIEIFK